MPSRLPSKEYCGNSSYQLASGTAGRACFAVGIGDVGVTGLRLLVDFLHLVAFLVCSLHARSYLISVAVHLVELLECPGGLHGVTPKTKHPKQKIQIHLLRFTPPVVPPKDHSRVIY
jgi:hypothetical protein